MKTLSKTLSTFFICVALLSACSENQNQLENFVYHHVTPAEFPDLDIPGFNFPEDSLKLNGWIRQGVTDSIYLHGWGIWTGLTSFTNQRIPGDSAFLRVYETWLTPEEMIDSIKGEPIRRSNRANLKIPNQLTHFEGGGNLKGTQDVNITVHESVSYSPGAANFAIANKIFLATTLYQYAVVEKRKEIPFFPTDAITTKPVFKLLDASSGETKFDIASWPGPPDGLVPFPEKNWNSYVTVDITNQSQPDGKVFNLNDFIHFKLNDEDAYYFNKAFTENQGNKFKAKPGDIAILVAMHVTSREITNWTWQTFWWAPDADNPPAPSSSEIAGLRPAQLQGAPRHYAMSVAYYMVNPNEPYSGTNVKGNTNYAFNPYLEAGFGSNVLDSALSFVTTSSGEVIETYVGVRTNCMSCHRMATVDSTKLNQSQNSITPYVGNSYVSLGDPLFDGQLLLDFAWSVEGNVDTTGWHSYMRNLEHTASSRQ